MAHVDRRNVVDVRSAAGRLGLSTQEVRRLIREQQLDARRVAGRWLIPVVELRRQAALDRPVGRPYDPSSAWALLAMLDGREPAGMSSVRRSQLRRVLRHADPDDLASRLRRRADRRLWYGHPSVLDDVLADPRVRPTAWFRAGELDLEVIVAEDILAEAYVGAGDLVGVVRSYGLQPADDIANLVLRVVPDGLPDGGIPVPVVALDLLESGDPRGVDAAWRSWHRLLAAFRDTDG